MTRNPFKAALARKEPQIGLWLSFGDADAAELSSNAGYQWLLIDGEHTPHTIHSMVAQLRAVELGAAHPVLRVPVDDATLIKQVLDVGARTVLVPMINTAGQAQAMVQAMRYPPQGIRGLGAAAARATRWGHDTAYLEHANDDACLLVQVETREAIQNLDAICAVDGVDGVFIGPADLSASLGHRGNAGHPEVQQVIEASIRTIVGHGKAAGILTADSQLARRYLELGATFVAVGIDVFVLAQGVRALAGAFGLQAPSQAPASY